MNPYIIGAAAAIAFVAGWTTNGWRYDASRTAALEADRAAQTQAYANDVAAEAKRLADNRTADAKTEKTIKTVTRYVKEDADYCGMRSRAVRVFDNNRTQLPTAK